MPVSGITRVGAGPHNVTAGERQMKTFDGSISINPKYDRDILLGETRSRHKRFPWPDGTFVNKSAELKVEMRPGKRLVFIVPM